MDKIHASCSFKKSIGVTPGGEGHSISDVNFESRIVVKSILVVFVRNSQVESIAGRWSRFSARGEVTLWLTARNREESRRCGKLKF